MKSVTVLAAALLPPSWFAIAASAVAGLCALLVLRGYALKFGNGCLELTPPAPADSYARKQRASVRENSRGRP